MGQWSGAGVQRHRSSSDLTPPGDDVGCCNVVSPLAMAATGPQGSLTRLLGGIVNRTLGDLLKKGAAV